MSSLVEIKAYVKRIYAKNQAYIDPVLKFLLAFIVITLINLQTGYMDKIDNMTIVLVASLFCSFMPLKTIAFVGAVFSLLHYYELALECALVVFVVYMIMFLLFIRFVPSETLVLLLTPICFMLNIPYVMPIAMGLLGSPASVVSVSCGIMISYLAEYIETNATVISSMDAENIVTKLRFMMDGLLGNDAMLFIMVAFAITLVLVYIIRKTPMNYSWTIATVAGGLADIVILLMGDLLFDLNYSIPVIVIGSAVGGVICMILQFFSFHLDYNRTENLQFEDDEYYYYVKAVPKIMVAAADKKVKKINTKRDNNVRTTSTSSVRTSHGVARTYEDMSYSDDLSLTQEFDFPEDVIRKR